MTEEQGETIISILSDIVNCLVYFDVAVNNIQKILILLLVTYVMIKIIWRLVGQFAYD